ncbi:MAG: hypothetical protein AABY96_11215 [Nitrospirota bacterium]
MLILLVRLLANYAVGIVLPFCVARKPQAQGVLGSICAFVAGGIGIALGRRGLVASEPMTVSGSSAIPLLAFAVRLDSLAAFTEQFSEQHGVGTQWKTSPSLH